MLSILTLYFALYWSMILVKYTHGVNKMFRFVSNKVKGLNAANNSIVLMKELKHFQNGKALYLGMFEGNMPYH